MDDSPFPPGVWQDLDDTGELCRALTQLRAFEQAIRQDTQYSDHVDMQYGRVTNPVAFRGGVVDARKYR